MKNITKKVDDGIKVIYAHLEEYEGFEYPYVIKFGIMKFNQILRGNEFFKTKKEALEFLDILNKRK